MRKYIANPEIVDSYKQFRYNVEQSFYPFNIVHKNWPYSKKSLQPIVDRGLKMMPKGWRVEWVVTNDRVLGDVRGMAFGKEKVIVVTSDSPEEALVTYLHELWHAKSDSLGELKTVRDTLKEEMDADLYSMLVLYKSPESPWYGNIEKLLVDQLHVVFAYGSSEFSRYAHKYGIPLKDMRKAIPSMYKFLEPYIVEAYEEGSDVFFDSAFSTPYHLIPDEIKKGYRNLLTKKYKWRG